METSPPSLPEQSGQKNNGLAIAAGSLGIGGLAITLIGFILSIASLTTVLPFCYGIGILMGIVGLILGIVALVQIKNNPGQKGKGMAITGIILGALGVLSICLIPAILLIFGPVVGNVFSEINGTLVAP
jgi:hypothetical protein